MGAGISKAQLDLSQSRSATPLAPQIEKKHDGSKQHLVEPGDTLGMVAESIYDGESSFKQRVLAIYKLNPGNFINADPNNLEVGSVLHLPPKDFVLTMNEDEPLLENDKLLTTIDPPQKENDLSQIKKNKLKALSDSIQQQISSLELSSDNREINSIIKTLKKALSLTQLTMEIYETNSTESNGNAAMLESLESYLNYINNSVDEKLADLEKQIKRSLDKANQ